MPDTCSSYVVFTIKYKKNYHLSPLGDPKSPCEEMGVKYFIKYFVSSVFRPF